MKNILRRVVVSILVLSVLVLSIPMAFAEDFTGYNCITTKEQLNDMRKSLSAKYYLGNDIVFTEADFAPGGAFYNDGKGWEPIGTNGSSGFKGTFDGNGHTIKGLKINASGQSTYFAGLFGYNLGAISNVDVEDIQITVADGKYAYVGAICGATSKKNVINCSASGSITVSGITAHAVVGGIAGGMYSGYIEGCLNKTKIKITNSSTISVGGIVGTASSNIYSCGNTGSIFAEGRGDVYGGGICGDAGKISSEKASISINDCYNVGTVDIDSICDCYAGGIVGDSAISVNRTFNNGVVAGRANTYEFKGLIVGRNNGGKLNNNYYVADAYEQGEGYTAITAEQAELKSTFSGFDFSTIWVIKDGIPVIKSFVEKEEEKDNSGDTGNTSSGDTPGNDGDSEVTKPVEPPQVDDNDDNIAEGGEGDGGVDIGPSNPGTSSIPTTNTGDNTDPENTSSDESTSSDITSSDSTITDAPVVSAPTDPDSTEDPFGDGEEQPQGGNVTDENDRNEWSWVIFAAIIVILITAGVVIAVKKGWLAKLAKK